MWKLIYAQAAEAAPAAAQAAEGANGAAPGNPLTGMLPMIIAFIAIMYFLMWRPQQKREKERRDMLNALCKGDSVVTTGGICGKVVGLSEENVVLRVDDNVTIEFVRAAVSQVIPKEAESK